MCYSQQWGSCSETRHHRLPRVSRGHSDGAVSERGWAHGLELRPQEASPVVQLACQGWHLLRQRSG